jgi:hypothetical protein
VEHRDRHWMLKSVGLQSGNPGYNVMFGKDAGEDEEVRTGSTPRPPNCEHLMEE